MPRTVSFCLLAALILSPAASWAKVNKDLTYSYQAIWSTAVRMLRADRGYKITDKDKDSGYILFIYPGSGSVKECTASMELLRTTDENGYDIVRVLLNIAHQPSYVALHLLDRLERKLLDERGDPPPRTKPKKKPTPPKKDEKNKGEDRRPGEKQAH